MGDISVC